MVGQMVPNYTLAQTAYSTPISATNLRQTRIFLLTKFLRDGKRTFVYIFEFSSPKSLRLGEGIIKVLQNGDIENQRSFN